MADQTITPPTIGARLAFAHALYPYPSSFRLRDLDSWCDPQLGGGHCAQIIAGKIKEPRRATLASIAKVLGCSPAWLAEGTGRAPTVRSVTQAVNGARVNAAVRKSMDAERAAANNEGQVSK